MDSETAEISRIRLDGDWSMGGVAERFPVLTKYLARFLNSEACHAQQKLPADAVPEIDLSGITGFDACGCQLLALFLRKLAQNGISPQLVNVSDAFKSQIHILGFDRELNIQF